MNSLPAIVQTIVVTTSLHFQAWADQAQSPRNTTQYLTVKHNWHYDDALKFIGFLMANGSRRNVFHSKRSWLLYGFREQGLAMSLIL